VPRYRHPAIEWVLGHPAAALGLILFAGIMLVPSTFFLCQMESDQLLYYLMAEHIAATGSANASLAVNLHPFVYASGVSYMYAPIMAAFHEFPERIRAIQALNIGLICCCFWLTTKYFRVAAPFADTRVLSWIYGIGIIIDAHWQQSTMVMNSNIVPAIMTVGGFLIAAQTNWTPRWKLAALLMIGGIGLFVKLSLVTIPIAYIASEFIFNEHVRKRTKILAAAGGIVLLTVFSAANYQVIVNYAIGAIDDPRYTVVGVSNDVVWQHLTIITSNLFFSALPGTVFPNLRYIFVDDVNYFTLAFVPHVWSLRLLGALVIGSAIMAGIVYGAWKLRKQRLFELLQLLMCVWIFAFVTNSTGRYLMAFQPLLWVYAAYAALPPLKRLLSNRRQLIAACAVCSVTFLLVEIRMLQLRLQSTNSAMTFPQETNIREVAETYGNTLHYLQQQDPQRTRLLYTSAAGNVESIANAGWGAATDIPMYSAEVGFPQWAAGHRVLAVTSCRKPKCDTSPWIQARLAEYANAGCYDLKIRKQWNNASAFAEVDEFVKRTSCGASESNLK
jgi:hypothetical protein